MKKAKNNTFKIQITAIIFVSFWILSMFAICAMYQGAKREYPLCGKVVEVNEEENYFCVEDFNGNIWEISDSEDWMVGDFCAMIMDNQGTPRIQDDIIKQCRYCGYEE